MQLELFPVTPLPVPKARRTAPVGRPAYARAGTKRRTLCADCVVDIHQRGPTVAPFPATARWRRSITGQPPMLLCDRHAVERQRQERGERR